MTPDQLIAEIWNLPWYQVIKVAFYDDFIFMCKIWPVWVLLLIIIFLYIYICTYLEIK